MGLNHSGRIWLGEGSLPGAYHRNHMTQIYTYLSIYISIDRKAKLGFKILEMWQAGRTSSCLFPAVKLKCQFHGHLKT